MIATPPSATPSSFALPENSPSLNKSLFALAMGGFGIGMTEFVIMGLLPKVSEQLQVTIPEAGYLISSYALGVVIGAPTLTALGRKLSPKTLLVGLMVMFTFFNGISALAPEYYSLAVFRFLSGLPHGAYFGIGSVVASRLAIKGKEAQAVSSMFAGLTIANVVGVPLATYVGYRFGWRMAFAMVAVVGVATVLSLRAWIPVLAPNPGASFREDLKIFRNPSLWLCIFITSIGFGGFFAWISYIAPLLIETTKFSPDAIPFLMTTAGLGMTVGIIGGGKLSDRFSAIPTAIVLMILVALTLTLNGLFAHSQPAMIGLCFTTGMLALAQCPPIQMLLIKNSKGAEMLGASLGQACFNIGNSLGALLGGIPLTMGYSYRAPQWVGVGMTSVGIILA
ncbi:MAG: MFS transporter, partial [Proteobacteria bacterium]